MAKKGTYPSTLEEREDFSSQLAELIRRFGADQLNIPQARPLMQVILTDRYDTLKSVDLFARYEVLLLSLNKQLELLVEYNKKYWGNVFSKEELEAVNTDSDHIQSVEDLEILHVDLGSPGKTLEGWAKVIEGTQPNYWRWDNLKSGTDYLRLLEGNTRQYKPGIHRVRINLAAHWEPKNGRTLVDVREQAKTNREILAHSEVLSAYGLHDALLREMDGTNLPYADMPGYECDPSGDGGWRSAPYLGWDADSSGASLGAYSVGNRIQSYAAPVVRES